MTLTDRELDILRYVANGFGKHQIAVMIGLKSGNHVQDCLCKIYRKIGVKNKAGAAAWYAEWRKSENI